ncbi:hypothetical protein ACJJTC_016816 [Scirpophaga incertulas]
MIPYVITWDGLVTKYHKKYRKKIGIQPKTEAYIQSLVLKKTLESISFERRHGLEEDDGHNEVEALERTSGDDARMEEKIEFDRDERLDAPDGELAMKQETIS